MVLKNQLSNKHVILKCATYLSGILKNGHYVMLPVKDEQGTE